jgi:hypothetical protein
LFGLVLYGSFSLMKKNQKIKAVFKSCDFAGPSGEQFYILRFETPLVLHFAVSILPPGIVLYRSFSLMKKNQKIKAVFKSCDFAGLSGGFAPKLAPPCVGAQTWALTAASKAAKSGFE